MPSGSALAERNLRAPTKPRNAARSAHHRPVSIPDRGFGTYTKLPHPRCQQHGRPTPPSEKHRVPKMNRTGRPSNHPEVIARPVPPRVPDSTFSVPPVPTEHNSHGRYGDLRASGSHTRVCTQDPHKRNCRPEPTTPSSPTGPPPVPNCTRRGTSSNDEDPTQCRDIADEACVCKHPRVHCYSSPVPIAARLLWPDCTLSQLHHSQGCSAVDPLVTQSIAIPHLSMPHTGAKRDGPLAGAPEVQNQRQRVRSPHMPKEMRNREEPTVLPARKCPPQRALTVSQ